MLMNKEKNLMGMTIIFDEDKIIKEKYSFKKIIEKITDLAQKYKLETDIYENRLDFSGDDSENELGNFGIIIEILLKQNWFRIQSVNPRQFNY